MTELNRPVRRVSLGKRREKSAWRALILSLEPGDLIGIRLQGTRQTFRLGAESVYELAVQWHERKIEKRSRQLIKTEGLKLRSARAKARKELKKELT
jgi:hypothetical protein